MALKPARKVGKFQTKSVASMIREAIDRQGYKDVKECARAIKVPYDLFNKVVGGHIPKDSQLIEYARKLKIDGRELILTAYRERAPDDMKRFFNAVQLLDNQDGAKQEILEILDDCNSDQVQELVQIARMVHASGRESCRKATSLLQLYQQMDAELMGHFESLILLAFRNDNLAGLREFKNALRRGGGGAGSRRARG